MSEATLWLPPRIDQAPIHNRFWNAVVSFTGTPLPLKNKTAAEVSLAEAPPFDRFACLLAFESGLQWLAVPVAFPFATVLGADLAVEDLPLIPDPLREAVLDGVVSLSGMVLPDTDHGALRFVESGPLATLTLAPEGEIRWFRANLHGISPTPAIFDVGMTLKGMAEVFGLDTQARQVWPALKTKLQDEVFVTVGRISAPASAMQEIREGSVIVLDRSPDPRFLQVRLRQTVFDFNAQDQTWACVAVTDLDRDQRRDPMSITAPPTTEPARIGDLQVSIDFDIGRVSVPLAELETWQRGSLVALSATTPAEGVAVTLRANGQPIGRGDLVQIDDRLAVRVTELNLRT